MLIYVSILFNIYCRFVWYYYYTKCAIKMNFNWRLTKMFEAFYNFIMMIVNLFSTLGSVIGVQ